MCVCIQHTHTHSFVNIHTFVNTRTHIHPTCVHAPTWRAVPTEALELELQGLDQTHHLSPSILSWVHMSFMLLFAICQGSRRILEGKRPPHHLTLSCILETELTVFLKKGWARCTFPLKLAHGFHGEAPRRQANPRHPRAKHCTYRVVVNKSQ